MIHTFIKGALDDPVILLEVFVVTVFGIVVLLYALEFAVRICNKRRGRPW